MSAEEREGVPLPGWPGSGGGSVSAREASIGGGTRLAAELVIRLSSIVATVWLTRSLGVDTFGSLIIGLSIGLMVAELCDLGLNGIVVPLLVRHPGNLHRLLVLKAAATGFVLVASFLLIPAASRLSGLPASLLGLCTIHFLGATWIEVAATSLRALGRRLDEVFVLLVFRLTLLGLIIGGPFGMTLRGASQAYAAAVGPALLLSAFLLAGRIKQDRAGSADGRSILRLAAPLGVNSYLAILSTRVELLLLQGFQGAAMVGLFGGALRVVESLLTLPSAIAAGALPSVAGDKLRGSFGAAQRMFGLVVWMAVPSAIGLALCASDVLAILGDGFSEGAPALRVLSVALVLCFGNAALSHILIGSGETGVIPKLTLMRVLVAGVLGYATIPALGVLGAALSFTGAELALSFALVQRARLHVHLEVGRPAASALLACVPMIVLLVLWSASLPARIAVSVALFGATAGLILRRGTVAGGLA